MGVTFETLPLRTCSRCENWVREYVTTAEAGCVVHNVPKYGSESCSKWVKA